MSTQPRSTKLTYEDYLLFPDDGKRHELIQGDHSMTPAPSTKHQRISRNLVIAMGAFIRQHALGDCSMPLATSSCPMKTWSSRMSCSSLRPGRA